MFLHLQSMEKPLKTNVIAAAKVDETTITDILENGAIDFIDNGGIYVTGYPFNFWIDLDRTRKLLIIYSFWETMHEVNELEMLRFGNEASQNKVMLQFSYNAEYGRFYAYYTHPYSVGLLAPHVLKLCQMFSSVFDEVVKDGIAGGILQDFPDCPCDNVTDEAAAVDGTVH